MVDPLWRTPVATRAVHGEAPDVSTHVDGRILLPRSTTCRVCEVLNEHITVTLLIRGNSLGSYFSEDAWFLLKAYIVAPVPTTINDTFAAPHTCCRIRTFVTTPLPPCRATEAKIMRL
jgi:hypothetical protein